MKRYKYFEITHLKVTHCLMECAVAASGQMVNMAYYSKINQGLQRYKNVIIQREAGPCGLYGQCIYWLTTANVLFPKTATIS